MIRAKRTLPDASDSGILQLIPREKLENDFPAVLIKEHIHWLNLSTSIMEFRPAEKPWESSPENWVVDCTPGRYRMCKGQECLVDVRSPSWTMLSELLKPLDSARNLLVTVSPIDPDQPLPSLRLWVALPRYGLSFFVDGDGDLQSRNIRGMVYDENQSIGTLFGLINQLVLRPKHRDNVDVGELIPRCVLIPEGEVSFRTNDHHVRVDIDVRADTLQRITYQTYKVDTDLGGLTGNVSLTNKLYRAYLHALTSSGCSADPLTGRSGTEEALELLRSASCRSIMKFSPRDAELLRLIASLCPSRSLHTRYKNIQIVHWLDLPTRSQSHHIYLAAMQIKQHLEKLQVFHDGWDVEVLKKFPSHDSNLFNRSLRRSCHLLGEETSEQLSRKDRDMIYLSRDLIPSDSAEQRVCLAARAIFQWSTDIMAIPTTDVVGITELWKNQLSSNAILSFTYHSSWLNPRVSTIWISAYNFLRVSVKSVDRFKILFTLPCMAYHSEKLNDLVPTLIAFAVHPAFRAENPPPHLDYNLSDGYEPSRPTISSYVTSSAKPLHLCPENDMPLREGESSRAFTNRKQKAYKTRLNREAKIIAGKVVETWPTPTPPRVALDSNAYDRALLNTKIRELFHSCTRNSQFRDHLKRVQRILLNVSAGSGTKSATLLPYRFDPSLNIRFRTPPSVALDQLVFTRPPPLLQSRDQLPQFVAAQTPLSSSGFHSLQRLIETVQSNPKDQFQCQYASDLEASAQHFCDQVSRTPASQVVMEEPSDEAVEVLTDYHMLCKESFADSLARTQEILGPSSESDRALERSGQWPHITTGALFRSIASVSLTKLTSTWKKCLIQLALLLLELQRARRLLRLAVDCQYEEFYKELNNGGCDGWDPEAEPDWVLIQVCSSLMAYICPLILTNLL